MLQLGCGLSTCVEGAETGQVLTIAYRPEAVVTIDASVGFAVHIALDPQERIERAAIGDAEHWTVVAQDGSHDVFLKPRAHAGPTNLAIRTDLRSYSFALRLAHNNSPTFRVDFRYPKEESDVSDSPVLNQAYSMQVGDGADRIRPLLAYDDDHETYLGFAPHTELPAVFEVLPDGSERLLNHHTENDLLVIHAVVKRLALRLGPAVISVFNDAAVPPAQLPAKRIIEHRRLTDRANDASAP